MSTKLQKWNSIKLFHNVVTTLNIFNERHGAPLPKVTYRGKVKLDGSNCGVQRTAEGLVPQSREQVLSPTNDLAGFAKWVETRRDFFERLPVDTVVFGEWCGPGVIRRGTAVSQIPNKIFAVFSVRRGPEPDWAEEEVDTRTQVSDPDEIKALLGELPEDVIVIPWQTEPFVIDFAAPDIEHLNKAIEVIEQEDPLIKKLFGVSGIGEGLVLNPIRVEGTGKHDTDKVEGVDQWHLLGFKAKGEKHSTVKVKKPVQIDPEVVKGAEAFAELSVTEARLDQGLDQIGGQKDKKLTGKFLQWVLGDIQKECQDELAASGLTWKQVQGAVSAKARGWFLS